MIKLIHAGLTVREVCFVISSTYSTYIRLRINRLFTLLWILKIPKNNYLRHEHQDQTLSLLRQSFNSTYSYRAKHVKQDT